MSEWKTAITRVEPNKIALRGYRVDELMGKISYAQAVYLAIKGELPDQNTGKLIDAILVSSIDHGVTPPSVLSALTIASTGAPLNAALAGGILSISRFHGGAIENCMKTIREVITDADEKQISIEKAASGVTQRYRDAKKRISGIGHRIHTKDPRTARLFSLAEELGFSGKFVEAIRALEKDTEKSIGKPLPINVDGAIAALLLELDIPESLANGFFIMARVPGLLAHIHEEQTRQKPMRVINPRDYEFDGTGDRSL